MQQYIEMYGRGLSGAMIMGTGYRSAGTLKAGKMLCVLMGGVRGWHYRSKIINNMALGSYNKSFKPVRTTADWLTRDEAIVDAYVAEPLCQFMFTVNGYYHMFRGMEYAQVSAGGADCSQFDPSTMESLLVPGLFEAGEVLTVDGDCGGYNLMFAFASGMIAGLNC